MSIDFQDKKCLDVSGNKLFGLCDDPPPADNRAYLYETDGAKWIAVVVNEEQYEVTFTAIDHCIPVERGDGKMAKRCDGMLTYNKSVIFVELKQRSPLGNAWVTDGEKQLKTTIGYFEKTEEAEAFIQKKAYIANSQHPRFKESQIRRMEKFLADTGYILRVENRIEL